MPSSTKTTAPIISATKKPRTRTHISADTRARFILYGGARRMLEQATISSKGGQLARLKSLNYALIFPENILLTLFFISMNTIFTSFRICENSYK